MKKIIFLLSTCVAINSSAQTKTLILEPIPAQEITDGNNPVARVECHPEYVSFEGCCANYAIVCNGNFQQMVSVCGSKLCQFIANWGEFVVNEGNFPHNITLDVNYAMIIGSSLQQMNEPERSREFNKLKHVTLILDQDVTLTTNSENASLIMKAGRYLLNNNKLEVTAKLLNN